MTTVNYLIGYIVELFDEIINIEILGISFKSFLLFGILITVFISILKLLFNTNKEA